MALLCSTDVTHLKRREVQIPHYHIKRALAALSAANENIQELWLLLEHRSTANVGLRNHCLLQLTCCPCLCQAKIERDSAKMGHPKSIRLDLHSNWQRWGFANKGLTRHLR